MKRIILALTLLVPVALSNAQLTQADVTYAITYSGGEIANYEVFLPSSLRMVFKGQNSRLDMDGLVKYSVITKGDEKSTYMVNHAMMTVQKTAIEESNPVKPIVTKMKSKAKILGYSCDKYEVITKGKGEEAKSYAWACRKLQVEYPKESSFLGLYLFEGVDGFPLKIELEVNERGMAYTTIFTAVIVNFDNVSDDEFEIPASYEVVEGSAAPKEGQ